MHLDPFLSGNGVPAGNGKCPLHGKGTPERELVVRIRILYEHYRLAGAGEEKEDCQYGGEEAEPGFFFHKECLFGQKSKFIV